MVCKRDNGCGGQSKDSRRMHSFSEALGLPRGIGKSKKGRKTELCTRLLSGNVKLSRRQKVQERGGKDAVEKKWQPSGQKPR